MATFVKNPLSGSVNGRGVKVVATASAGTTIHTAVAGTVGGTWDEIWLWAYNSDAVSRLLTVQYGGTTAVDDDIKVTIPSQTGLTLVVPGLILDNGTIVKAYAAAANVIVMTGYVNSIT